MARDGSNNCELFMLMFGERRRRRDEFVPASFDRVCGEHPNFFLSTTHSLSSSRTRQNLNLVKLNYKLPVVVECTDVQS
jgi:hypothetical protein